MNEAVANRSGRAHSREKVIYVVDDEALLLELVSVILEPCGYDIKTFHDPESALRAYASAQPEPALIITDYAMHTMNGLELLAACRRIQPRQKALLVSGTVGPEVLDHAPCQPDRFLSKPYQAKQLIVAVKSLLAD